ncbi:gas vesicle protein GvpJ [Natrinema longum]|uniref:Gas vesicle protein n=1 Tax=Natrinema longum TaxID=370324 RepID=A0A8A2U7Z9_9EURY|nr:gas vesicle protein GvpJ [Natrinema longum]MBZ6494603.1 gas vesicle protein [Natrinema longum]QSW84078.1 gas vesicle protein [Natrinema longum]
MEPEKNDDAVVDLVDVLLEDGAVLAADVVISVADIPLIGLRLRLLLAGMTTMRDHDILADADDAIRDAGRRAESYDS